MQRNKTRETYLKDLTRYRAPAPERNYRFTPTSSVPDPARLVNSKPYWPDTVIGEVDRPKTFIITDFSVRYNHFSIESVEYDKSKFKDPRELWEILLKQGIKCYVWTGKLTEVKDMTSLLVELHHVELVDSQVLDAELIKNNITQDEREIVDVVRDAEIRHQLGLCKEENFIFNISEYAKMSFTAFKKLIDTLPQVGKISLEVKPNLAPEAFIHYALSNLKNIHTLELAHDGVKLLSDLLNKKPCPWIRTIKNLIVKDYLFNPEHLHHVAKHLPLEIEMDLGVNFCYQWMPTGQRLAGPARKMLKRLIVVGGDAKYRQSEDEFLAHVFKGEQDLTSLTELTFIRLVRRDREIINYINATPKLECMMLEGRLGNVGSGLAFDELMLRDLQVNVNVTILLLSDMEITTENLIILLSKFPNLNDLNINNLIEIDFNLLAKTCKLANLSRLTVDKVNYVSMINVSALVRACPQLRHIRTDQDLLLFRDLSNLETLYLTKGNLNSLLSLLERLPDIEQLNAEILIEVNQNQLISSLTRNLDRLKYIKIWNGQPSNISFLTFCLKTILSKSPNAEDILFQYCGECFQGKTPDFQLTKVKRFSSSLTPQFSTQELANIAFMFPNMEALTINSTDFQLDRGYEATHDRLTELTINIIDFQGLADLLTFYPNIKKLNIGSLTGKIPGNLSLERIESLKIGYVVEASQLFEMLALTKNLTSLSLPHVANNESPHLNPNLDKLKILTLTDNVLSKATLETALQILKYSSNLEILKGSMLAKRQLIASPDFTIGKIQDIGILNFELCGTDVTNDQLLKMLHYLPSVNKITISNCENLTGDILDAEFTLPAVTEITLQDMTMTVKQFKELLRKCPNLQSVLLQNPEAINLLLDPKLSVLDRLKIKIDSIDFSYLKREITSGELGAILNFYPYGGPLVNSRHLIGTFSSTSPFEVSCHAYTHSPSEMPIEQACTYFPHCPNLSCIVLNDSDVTAKHVFRILIENKSVTEIVVITNSISEDELTELRKAFPSVKFNRPGGIEQVVYTGRGPYVPKYSSAKNWMDELRKEGHTGLDEAAANIPSLMNRGIAKPQYQPNTPRAIDIPSEKSTETHARMLFAPKSSGFPVPNHYRLDVYPEMEKGEAVKYKVAKYAINPITEFHELKNLRGLYGAQFRETDDVFYGQFEIPAGCQEWYPVPSLTAGDKVMDMAAKLPIELGYCDEQRLYYVRAKSKLNDPLPISFLLNAKATPFKFDISKAKKIDFSKLRFGPDGKLEHGKHYDAVMKELAKLDITQRIAALARFCHFEDKIIKTKFNSDIEELNALIETRIGVCRHSTWVFKALADEFGLQCNAVENDCHAYIEVCSEHGWQSLDLGGGIRKLVVEPMKEEAVTKVPDPVAPPLVPKDKEELSNDESPAPSVAPAKESSGISHDNPFKIWDTIQTTAENMLQYCHDIITTAEKLPANKRNVLIVIPDDKIEAFSQQMARYLQDKNQGLYYLHSLDEVAEKQAVVENGALNVTRSDLLNFVAGAKPSDVIMSNWSDYKPSFIGYNTMMDAERKLGSEKIPDGAIVLAICDENQMKMMREDFTARFRLIHQAPDLPGHENVKDQLLLPANANLDNFEQALFFDDEWKTLLLGAVDINGSAFTLDEGELVKAINEKKPGLLLKNAPWENAEFRIFMNDLLLKRSFNYNGKPYKLPENFSIYTTDEPYQLTSEKIKLATPQTNEQEQYILNRQTFNYFLKTMTCKKDLIFRQSGWLKANTNKPISVLVTEDIPEKYWAWVIQQAEANNCELNLTFAPGVCLPHSMKLDAAQCVVKPIESHCIRTIYTNDLEFVEEAVCSVDGKATVISINSRTTLSDLVERLEKVEDSVNLVAFRSILGTVGKILFKSNDKVILKGALSPELAKQLETLFLSPPYLWINGEKRTPTGKLIVLTDNKPASTLMQVKTQMFSDRDFWQRLDEVNDDNPQYIKFKAAYEKLRTAQPHLKFSYGQLRAMSNKLRHDNLTNPFKPYFRLNLDEPLLAAAKDVWDKPAKVKNPDAMQRRHSKILSELEYQRYLFLVGPSGVGKSTYVLKELKNAKLDVYVGLDNIKAWLGADDTEDRILFIDEANLEHEGALELLEGLFNKTPGLNIDGEFKSVNSKRKKIVCAGNYQHFAGRHEHRLFARHGQVFSFKELPDEALAKDIIHPTLKSVLPSIPENELQIITEVLLKVYGEINTILPGHPLTPRNLNMICFRLRGYIEHHANELDESSDTAIKLAILDEVESILDKGQKDQLRASLSFNDKDKQVQKAIRRKLPNKLGKYHVSKSRVRVLHALHEQFSLRDLKLTNKELTHLDVPGILIEGLPRIGKSDVLLQYLESQGFKEAGTPGSVELDSTKIYYKITPTAPEKMQETLLKAFHEGAVVIVDEMNSLPFEKFMNHLISGYDLNGKRPNKPGFMILATQNPIDFVGRQKLSAALINRFLKINLKNYSDAELYDIGNRICMDQDIANHCVGEYIAARNYAKQHHKIPEPTPGDLFAYLSKVLSVREEVVVGEMTAVRQPVARESFAAFFEKNPSTIKFTKQLAVKPEPPAVMPRADITDQEKDFHVIESIGTTKSALQAKIDARKNGMSVPVKNYLAQLNTLISKIKPSPTESLPGAKIVALLNLQLQILQEPLSNNQNIYDIVQKWKAEKPLFSDDESNYALISSNRKLKKVLNLFWRPDTQEFIDDYFVNLAKRK